MISSVFMVLPCGVVGKGKERGKREERKEKKRMRDHSRMKKVEVETVGNLRDGDGSFALPQAVTFSAWRVVIVLVVEIIPALQIVGIVTVGIRGAVAGRETVPGWASPGGLDGWHDCRKQAAAKDRGQRRGTGLRRN